MHHSYSREPPEVFLPQLKSISSPTVFEIKPFASIDSEIQIDQFQIFEPLNRGSNHALYYGELGNKKYFLKQYPHASDIMKQSFDKEVSESQLLEDKVMRRISGASVIPLLMRVCSPQCIPDIPPSPGPPQWPHGFPTSMLDWHTSTRVEEMDIPLSEKFQ